MPDETQVIEQVARLPADATMAAPPIAEKKRLPTPASWQPGQTGNPNGSPRKKRIISNALYEVAQRPAVLADGTAGTRAQLIAEKVADLAEAGERWAVEVMGDRIEGKPRQVVEMSQGEDDEPRAVVTPIRIGGEGE